MAERIGLNPTYLSALENGREPVDDEYVKRAEGIALEMAGKLEDGYEVEPTERGCVEYLRQFLATCKGDKSKLGWTLVELQERFPLTRWEDRHRRAYVISEEEREQEAGLRVAEAQMNAEGESPSQLSQRKGKAGESSAPGGGQSGDVSPVPKSSQAAPKRAQG